jgi:branched-chain amino acid transport system permease protein
LLDRAASFRTPVLWAAGAVALWAVLNAVLAKGLPLGIIVLGIIYGSTYALLAIGIVLVYRANRIINFAQAQIGVLAAILAIELKVTYNVNFFLAILVGIVAAVVIGVIISLLPRHFQRSSRLILTVATIGLGQALGGFSAIVPLLFCPPSNASCATAAAHQTFNTPLNFQFTINPVVFSGNDVVAFVGAVIIAVALALFMKRSKYGLAIRAASENGERATLLGVPVPRLDTIVWVIAALLSAATILLRVPVLGFGGFQTVTAGGDDILLRTLAAAVIGRMENMPRTVVAALAIGVFDSGATWTYSNTTFVDATLFIVIIVALLLQRKTYSRASEAESSTWRSVAAVRPIPRVLAALPEVRWTLRGGKTLLAALALAIPFILSDSQTYLTSIILIYAIVGLSLLILTGWTGQISLGQFGISGIAGATAAFLYSKHGWDFIPSMIVAVVVGALVALIIGVPALRISGPFLAVTTLAFGVSAANYVLSPTFLPWFVVTTAPRPPIFGADILGSDRQVYYFCLIGFFLALVAVRSMRQSRTGRGLIATRDNEAAARATGLNTTREKLTAFLISGAMAGFAGALFVVQAEGVNNGSFTADINIALFTMVVIGGLGSVPGVVVGAVAVWSAMYFLPAGWAELVNGGGILLLLIFLPEGLGGLIYGIRGVLLFQVAKRRGLAAGAVAAQLKSDTSLGGEEVISDDEPMPLASLSGSVGLLGQSGASAVSGSALPTNSQASSVGPVTSAAPSNPLGPGSTLPG